MKIESKQQIADEPDFTNPFDLRPRFAATLANWPIKGSKSGHKKSRSVETERLRWLVSPSGLRRPDLLA